MKYETLNFLNISNIRQYLRKRKICRKLGRWNSDDENRLQFYSSLIPSDSIIFDVGANLGNRTKIFSRLGAKVIAIEPQTYCFDILSCFFKRNDKVTLIKTALGSEEGESEIFISNAHTISSMSPEWIQAVEESGRFSEYKWEWKEDVKVTTLDRLIDFFGEPAFIKIDVEGFEDKVIAGLSRPVKLLSLEFTPEHLEPVFNSIDHLSSLSNVEVNYSLEESMVFALDKWDRPNIIKERLRALDKDLFGDIYVRRT